MLSFFRIFLVGLLIMTIPTTALAVEFATPQDAVQGLQDALRAKDLKAAAAIRDFREEARILLLRHDPGKAEDPETLRQGAVLMEVIFEEELKQNGFPSYDGLTCVLSEPIQVNDTLVKVTERCESPTGASTEQAL